MNILFDTNVLLDVFLERHPFFKDSALCVALAENRKLEGWLCSTTVTTIRYLLSKNLSEDEAVKHIRKVLEIFHISGVNRAVLEKALESGIGDYEDAVLHQSAVQSNLDVILTRNQKDFKKSEIPVYNPTEFLTVLQSLK